MATQKEKGVFESYLAGKNLRHSRQRQVIMDVFLGIDRHVTADEIFRAARKDDPRVGCATVYRTLKLLRDCGLCRELKFEDGTTRYEHLFAHRHHDHLICVRCGKFVEVAAAGLEREQRAIMKRHGFRGERHRMDLYGVCGRCANGGDR